MIPRPMILVFPRRPVCLVAVLLMLRRISETDARAQ